LFLVMTFPSLRILNKSLSKLELSLEQDRDSG
jgi:hypothetical protein